MSCRAIRPLLSAYCDQELKKEDAAAVESHLARCRGCAGEYESLVKTIRILGKLKPRKAPRRAGR